MARTLAVEGPYGREPTRDKDSLMRRILVSAVLAATLASAALLGACATAGATSVAANCAQFVVDCGRPIVARKVYADQDTQFVGWGRIDLARCFEAGTAPYCATRATDIQCFRAPCPQTRTTVTAYRWAYGAWTPQTLTDRTPVYIYPYGSGWSWVWSSATGWLAVRSSVVLTREGTCTTMCPM